MSLISLLYACRYDELAPSSGMNDMSQYWNLVLVTHSSSTRQLHGGYESGPRTCFDDGLFTFALHIAFFDFASGLW